MSSENPAPNGGPTEPAGFAAALESRLKRQHAFKAHLAVCQVCAREDREMCQDGYRLLVEALK